MTERKTVTFDETIYEAVKDIRAEFIKGGGDFDDMSFTTAVNMLVLGGILFAPDSDDEQWSDVRAFLEDRAFELDQSWATDRYAEVKYLEDAVDDEDSE